SALLIRRQTRLSRGVKGTLVTGIIVTTLVTSVAAASAQNIFEALFGRLWSSHSNANADPNTPLPSPEATHSEDGLAYRAPMRRTLFPNSTSRRGKFGADLQLVLSGERNQGLQRQRHHSRGRTRRQALLGTCHRVRVSKEDHPRLHLQRQGRLRPRQHTSC